MEHRIERLEELAIALNAEIEKAAGALPEIKAELQGFIAARVAELAADAKTDAKKDVRAQCEAIRLETAKKIDEHMAAIMAKRQEVCQLAEIEPALKAFAERAAAGVLREFARESDTKLESIKHEFAKVPKFKHEFAAGGAALADAMRGNWEKETTYKRGDIFTFRGSSYLVLRESRGVLPTQQEQKGASPRYAVIAAAGAPGPKGVDGLSAQAVGITSSSLTMNTARILGRTTAGIGSIEELPYTGTGSVVLSASPTISGTVSTTGTLTFAATTGMQHTGTTTNDNAATGYVGEYLSSTAAGISLTTGIDSNVTSVSLSAGDWDVEGTTVFSPSATLTLVLAGVSSTSGVAPTGTDGLTYMQSSAFPSGSTQQITSGTRRFSIGSTTTVYLVARAVFASGTCLANGTIRARRVR